MIATVDLEFTIHRHEQNSYAVDFRFSDNDLAEVRLGASQLALTSFDFAALAELRATGEMQAYGAALTQALFAPEPLRVAFLQARAAAAQRDAFLRVRLAIAPSATELHSLCWETLCDPQTGVQLAMDRNIFFSRYLSSLDWRPVRLRAKGELKALAVIAAPIGLEAYKLSRVDKAAETASIAAGLGQIGLETLQQATLSKLIAALTANESDILYLVAHGTFVNGEGYLWLENESGGVERVPGAELVKRLRELEQRPRLVVLISCQSAGRGEGEVLAALGPQLAEAGIPAVLAMQANLSMATSAKLMPLFFTELQKDGQIDRALTVTRGLVREQPDWWAPVLFMRLKSGRLWYVPGFADARKGFEKFPAQVQNIKNRHLTPILGPGLTEGLFGSPQQIARSWAETFHYPMDPHERESLPQVAQYLTINQQKSFPYEDLMAYLRQRLQTHFASQLETDLCAAEASFPQVLEAVGKLLRIANPDEPHRALAELPVEVYLSTNADTLLEGALREAGKKPQTRLCPWNEYTAEQEAARDDETYSVERPLVYHLFGLWKERPSLVLTEDNYFDFLLGMARNKALIPLQVKKAMTDSGLLFLGFQTHEWQFRVLFRAILSLPGQRYDEYANIAAQIEPEDGRILEPERAREYLEQYFSKGHRLDLSIFWGTPEEFITELMRYWRRSA